MLGKEQQTIPEQLCEHCKDGGFCQTLAQIAKAKADLDKLVDELESSKAKKEAVTNYLVSVDISNEIGQLYNCPNSPKLR